MVTSNQDHYPSRINCNLPDHIVYLTDCKTSTTAAMQFKDPSLVSMAFLAATCLAFPTAAQGSLSWQDCPAALAPPIPGIRCAYLDVPMDWDSPHNSGTVKLGMVKLPAQKPNVRFPSLGCGFS